MLRSSSAATATGLAIVSRQPRLPQRQIGPCGSREDVADLAGDAGAPVVRPAGEDEAGADARRQADVDEIVDAAARRRTAFSPSAPTLASFSSWTGMPSRASISAAGPDAVPAGQDAVGLELAGRFG